MRKSGQRCQVNVTPSLTCMECDYRRPYATSLKGNRDRRALNSKSVEVSPHAPPQFKVPLLPTTATPCPWLGHTICITLHCTWNYTDTGTEGTKTWDKTTKLNFNLTGNRTHVPYNLARILNTKITKTIEITNTGPASFSTMQTNWTMKLNYTHSETRNQTWNVRIT